MDTNYEYVIIGNSAGGIGAIEAIRERDHDGRIAVISEEKGPAYCRALIPYLINGRVDRQKIIYRGDDFYEQNDVKLILGAMADSVDFDGKVVKLADGRLLGYSRLLLATGGEPFLPPIDGVDLKNVKNVFSFTNISDALAINQIVDNGTKYAVVLGAGLLGLLAAEVLRQRGLDVTVVELMDRVLGPVLDDTASNMIRDTFERAGVSFRLNTTITSALGGETVRRVQIKDSGSINCDLLVLAIGVRPHTGLASDSRIDVERGIAINRQMETAIPGVYACGDCAKSWDFVTEEFRNLPIWPVAYAGGRVAGHNMTGDAEEYTWGTSMNSFDFFGEYAMSAGIVNPPAGDTSYREISSQGRDAESYRKLVFHGSRLVGFCFVNSVERAGLYLNLMRRKIDVTGLEDVLLGEDFDLIDLPDAIRVDMLFRELETCAI